MAAIIETSHVSHCGQESGCPCSGLAREQGCQLCARHMHVLLGVHAVEDDSFAACQPSHPESVPVALVTVNALEEP